MNNVMATLNTFGLEYSINEYGFEVRKDLEFLKEQTQRGRSQRVAPYEVVNFGRLNPEGGERFEQKFEEFLNIPQHSKVSGMYWAEEDEQSVLILLNRMYEMSLDDWEEYASLMGCEDIEEAQAMHGDPAAQYAYLCVRVAKDDLYSFVRIVAAQCW